MRPRHRSRGLALAFAVVVLAGCRTVDYTPRIVPFEDAQVAPFANHPTVALRNSATTGKILIVEERAFTCNGDLHDWTRVAIELAASELGKRGVTIGDGGGKSVDLAITHVEVIYGFAATRCILKLHATTGDGRSFDVEGNNASPATVYRAMDGAVSRAVAALLGDPRFRAWIEGR